MARENGPRPRILRFATFEVDLQARELRKNGLKLKLHGQPFEVLAMLLERPGEVVNREQLRERLWPTDTFVDFDHGVNTAINRLREALGDSADNPHFIETLPRRGYRFIAPIESIPPVSAVTAAASSATPQAQPTPLPEADVQPRHGKRLVWILPAFLLFGVLVAANVGRFQRLFGEQPRTPIQSIAVLPLVNLSGDPQQEHFTDGMTEELIGELSRIGSLRVISRTSVMQYKGEKKPLPQIGRELNVDAVMEGSVLRSGNRVRIVAHMIYAPTDQNLMTETYERDFGDVLKLQREVAESIAERVRVKLTPEQQLRLEQAVEVNPEAYEAYLMAISLDWSRQQQNKKAQSYLEKAIQKDPGFAPAYVELAWRYLDLGQFRWLSPREAYPPAKQALRKALELDEKNCRAHFQLAWLAWRYDWDWQTAETEFKHALELCPSDARTHWEHAYYSAWSGRGAEALAEIAKTRELDPLMPILFGGEALVNYQLRNYTAMIDAGRRFVSSDANYWVAHFFLGVGYEGSGRTRDSIPEYQKAIELSEGDQDPTAALAHAYAATGGKEEAKKILREWQHQSESSYVSPYMIATVYASLGEKDKAFAYLEKAYQERSSDLPYFLKADLRLDSLRSDPRFQDLLRRMNFPQ